MKTSGGDDADPDQRARRRPSPSRGLGIRPSLASPCTNVLHAETREHDADGNQRELRVVDRLVAGSRRVSGKEEAAGDCD